MSKKSEPMATAGFMVTIKIPHSLYDKMPRDDRLAVKDLAVFDSASLTHKKFVFRMGDLLKIRGTLARNGVSIRFPPAKEMKRFGISYTGDSLEIVKEGDNFILTQYFPDGEIRSHIIPDARVWETYNVLQYLVKEKGTDTLKARDIWEQLARYHGLKHFFYTDANGEVKFSKSQFNGSRGTYHNLYYFPIKVLEHIGKIEYSKSGVVRVLSKEEINAKRRKATA